MVRLIACVLFVCCLSPLRADAAECADFVPNETVDPADPDIAEELAGLAREASEAECWAQSDRLWEGAYRVDPRPRFLYERILVRERMGDTEFAFELLDGYRDELVTDPTLRDLVDLDARLRAALRGVPPEPNEAAGLDEPAAVRRSTLDTIGPIAVALAGGVGLGLAVYGMSAKCELAARDGECLRGSEVSQGPTTAYAIGGVLALVGAAVWWIAAIPESATTRAQIRPDGLLVRY